MNIYPNRVAEETPPNREDKNGGRDALYTR